MHNCDLGIYYDNPNEAPDMYLKWLLKDCEENNISVRIFDDLSTFWKEGSNSTASLFLEPIKNKHAKVLQGCFHNNVDNPSATAQGIYNYITEHYPNREENICVIGRGLVGKQLIDMLIDYGYTVIECNSKTPILDLRRYAILCTIVVGLATEQVFDNEWCETFLAAKTILIDSGNNFDTKNKLRCGKWTRNVIIDRIKKLKEREER